MISRSDNATPKLFTTIFGISERTLVNSCGASDITIRPQQLVIPHSEMVPRINTEEHERNRNFNIPSAALKGSVSLFATR